MDAHADLLAADALLREAFGLSATLTRGPHTAALTVIVVGPGAGVTQHERFSLEWTGLDYTKEKFDSLMEVTKAGAKAEAEELRGFFEKLGPRLPAEIEKQRKALAERAEKAPEVWRPE